MPIDKMLLAGIYFTSNQQSGTSVNILTQAIAESFVLSDVSYQLTCYRSQPYFVQGMFDKVIH
ncbi:type VI secretion protein IcmF/TssM N-terminal domain-containing protein [Candidatus Coxiella mudrowiae]|uniref:type VI secretion protein IcmF/TssM N-terminal domain-containing protein n=1 Tax=Candidatus Coxiella mudrowiae TaxID=2054173 RepID=UPI0009E26853|nr:type VI secretion protein IcmF/TssM N-terminal domain-containing protein [Candidatus Coxiella mudrowiae]